MSRTTYLRTVFLVWIALCLAACTTLKQTFSDRQVEYEKATTLPSLEVPPDLAAPTGDDEMAIPSARAHASGRYSEYAAATDQRHPAPTANADSNAVLPAQSDIRVVREGDKRWLVVQSTPDQIWSKVHDFWLEQGFVIKTEDQKAGILETDWLENRANVPQSGIRALFGKVLDGLYDSSMRDRFRVRLERGEASGTTEIYISHVGAQEIAQGDSTVWQLRPNDPELEAAMLQRLMVFMGVQEKAATTMLAAAHAERTDQARLTTTNGTSSLVVEEDFPHAWRHTGLALDRVGFTVEDRDRSSGIYYVRYNDPLKDNGKKPGFFSRLAFWRSDAPPSAEQYQIHLQDRGSSTVIVVQNKDGTPNTSPTGQRILSLLSEQLH